MPLLDFICGWIVLRKLFSSRTAGYGKPKYIWSRKTAGPPPTTRYAPTFDERIDDAYDKLYDLEDTLKDIDDDCGFGTTLKKVSKLLKREYLSETDLDLIEEALNNVENLMNEYEDSLEADNNQADEFDPYDPYTAAIEEDLDKALLQKD